MVASISRSLTRKLLRPVGGSTLPAKWGPLVPPPTPTPTPTPTPSSSFCTSAPSISSASQPQLAQEKERRSIWSKLMLFIPGAITFGLGTWQIFRRQEKIKKLEYTQKRLEMDPIRCNQIAPSSENLESLEFRRVACKGVFDENKSVFVGPRSRSISGVTENGYYLITPLMPIPGDPDSMQSPILVNRGWVPRSWRDKSVEASENDEKPSYIATAPAQESAKGSWWSFWSKKPKSNEDQVAAVNSAEVIGVVRTSEKPSIFVPANDPSSYQWFYVDVPAIARACGLPENTLYIEAIKENTDASNPYPLPKDPNTLIRSSVMPQDHLNYMLTWYSLSAAVTFMAFKRLRPKKTRR